MFRTARNISLYAGMAVTALIALYSLRYLITGADSVDALSQTDVLLEYLSGQESTFWRDFSTSQKPLYHANEFTVVGHISAASIALITGIFQLIPLVRVKTPLLHRASGYLYTFTAVVGLVLGAYISFTLPMIGGTKAVVSNILGGVLGVSFIVISFVCIWKKQYLKHGHWMLRSYAVLMTILTIYLLIGVFSLVGLDPQLSYGFAHMICFPINLLIAELVITRSSPGFFGGVHTL